MKQHRGYYSLIQFCPDPSRLECVNVGVALFSNDERRLQVRMSKNSQRIRRVFGTHNTAFVRRAQRSIEGQLQRLQFTEVAEFEAYIERRANVIQMTKPRSVCIENLEQDTDELFTRLVGEEVAHHRQRIDRVLTERLAQAGIADLVKEIGDVEIPGCKKSIRAQYGYQNGRFNLVTPMLFDPKPDAIFAKLGKSALEGQLLYERSHPEYGATQLVVVAQLDPQTDQSMRELVRDQYKFSHVKLHLFEDLNPLVEDIRHAASLHLRDLPI